MEKNMAIDFDAIRAKLNKLSGNNRSRNTMWRPTEGEEHTVRLISFPNNEGQPFKELWFYYNIPGQRGLLAPYQFNEKDPIQELITKLRDDGTKESYDLAKKLYPSMRCYAAVVVRGEEEKGVQIWSFGKTVYQTLLNYMLDEDYGDITDPTDGFDIKVSCNKRPGQQYAMTEVRPRPRSTALSKDSKKVKEWLGNIPDPGEMFSCKSYDELSKIVNDWLTGDDEEDTGTEHTSSKSSTPNKSKAYSDIDDAFADLMED
tara:strand:- start:5821 stop:6597 length:777 start_codon:yes stop_codon:yes gene_type:complete